jgi:N-acetyl-1-D-myo-inositol-2-amino-2-deoxy-alpha-D-glucopyranoside deacetylase
LYAAPVGLTEPRLLLVHAHPDDETIWTGGAIARYVAAGVRVTVLTCTLGEEGEIIPPELAELGAGAADQLGGYRIGELRAACRALGVTDHRFLGGPGRWRDSGMAGAHTNDHPRAFVGGDVDEQVAQLDAIIREVRPQVVVSDDAGGGYGHPDHIRAHRITAAASARSASVARIFHVVWSRRSTDLGLAGLASTPDLPHPVPAPRELPATEDSVITTSVDVSDQLPRKLAALRAHATQVSVWEGDGVAAYVLSDGLARPVVDTEYFVLARGNADGAATDLFGGLSGN